MSTVFGYLGTRDSDRTKKFLKFTFRLTVMSFSYSPPKGEHLTRKHSLGEYLRNFIFYIAAQIFAISIKFLALFQISFKFFTIFTKISSNFLQNFFKFLSNCESLSSLYQFKGYYTEFSPNFLAFSDRFLQGPRVLGNTVLCLTRIK